MSQKLYFSIDEINQHKYTMPPNVLANINILIPRLSLIREAYGRPMIITSGYRSPEDQARIYKDKPRVPMGSQHLIGGAADIADRDGSLAAFCFSQVPLLESTQLWVEDPTRTKGWVHFQITPPASGNRFFMP